MMAKTKALISFAVTAKLICAFVFADAKRCFSHDAAQTINQFQETNSTQKRIPFLAIKRMQLSKSTENFHLDYQMKPLNSCQLVSAVGTI